MHRIPAPRRARRGPLSPDPSGASVSIIHGPPDGSGTVLLIGASRTAARPTPAVLLSFVNTSPSDAVKLSVKLAGRTPTSMAGTILTAAPFAACAEFRGAVLRGRVVEITVPARSLVVLTVNQHAAAARTAPVNRSSTM